MDIQQKIVSTDIPKKLIEPDALRKFIERRSPLSSKNPRIPVVMVTLEGARRPVIPMQHLATSPLWISMSIALIETWLRGSLATSPQMSI
jgi:hypothetical protein